MKSRLLNRLPTFAVLLISTGFLAGQASFSAGPLLLRQVKTIYVAPSSDDFVLLIKARLEKWEPIKIATKPEEADAILTCRTESTIVPAKVVVMQTIAEATLVDRRSQEPIWKSTKFVGFDRAMLADDITDRLKRDWRKSASAY